MQIDTLLTYARLQMPSKMQSKAAELRGKVKEKAEWEFYRLKFSQTDEKRDNILKRLGQLNDKLEKLLQVGCSDDQSTSERAHSKARDGLGISRFWQHAGRVFTALSTVWNCSCRARHSTRLLLEHRTSMPSDLSILYDKGQETSQPLRMIRISRYEAEKEKSATIRISVGDARNDGATTWSTNHRTMRPGSSALRQSALSSDYTSRYDLKS